jgi:hypothetical protein
VPPEGYLWKVAGDSAHAWAVGNAGPADGGALVYELFPDGGARVQPVDPNVPLFAIAMLPDGGFVAAGIGCFIFESSWTQASQCDDPNATLYDVSASGSDIWAVGDNGVAAHRADGGFSIVPTGVGPSVKFEAVLGIPGQGVWIGADPGHVMHRP